MVNIRVTRTQAHMMLWALSRADEQISRTQASRGKAGAVSKLHQAVKDSRAAVAAALDA